MWWGIGIGRMIYNSADQLSHQQDIPRHGRGALLELSQRVEEVDFEAESFGGRALHSTESSLVDGRGVSISRDSDTQYLVADHPHFTSAKLDAAGGAVGVHACDPDRSRRASPAPTTPSGFAGAHAGLGEPQSRGEMSPGGRGVEPLPPHRRRPGRGGLRHGGNRG